MAEAKIERRRIIEGHDFYNSGRLEGGEGTAVVQADVSSWELRIFDITGSTPATAIYTDTGNAATDTNPDGAAILTDTLRTDGYWEGKDDDGYNFRHTVQASVLDAADAHLEGGKTYRLEYEIITGASAGADYGTVKGLFEVEIVPTYTD